MLEKIFERCKELKDTIKLHRTWQDLIDADKSMPVSNPYGTEDELQLRKEEFIKHAVYNIVVEFIQLNENPKFKDGGEESYVLLDDAFKAAKEVQELAGGKDKVFEYVKKHSPEDLKDDLNIQVLSITWDVIIAWGKTNRYN